MLFPIRVIKPHFSGTITSQQGGGGGLHLAQSRRAERIEQATEEARIAAVSSEIVVKKWEAETWS